MQLLHTADIHLGIESNGDAYWEEERSAEIWDSFYRLIETAETEEPELLLIAGDLFHRTPTERELKEVNDQFSQLSKTKVVMMAGDHDYIGAQSVYKDFAWASNVVFFKKNHISYVYLASMNAIIYSMSYDRPEMKEPMYDGLRPMRRFRDGRPVPEDCRHILMAHGGDAAHIPMNLNKLRQAGFDYVALGHSHTPWIDESGIIAYAGALEPIDGSDEAVHGYMHVILTDAGTDVEFVPFAKRMYASLEIEVLPSMTMEDILRRVQRGIAGHDPEAIYKVVLNGRTGPDLNIDKALIQRMGRIYAVEDRLETDIDFEALRADNHDNLVGWYIDAIEAMPIEESLKQKALTYGVKAFYQIGQEEKR